MSNALGAAGELAIRSLIERAPLASSLAQSFKAKGFTLALVGGPVRDALLGRLGNDLDFTTNALPQETKKILNEWAENVWDTGIAFGTVAGKRGDTTVEVTTYRSETYDSQSRKPDVQYGKEIHGDLSRRDFTINAMALELTTEKPEFIDPFLGLEDLARKLLRTPSSAEQSFSDDPLRMMRAARFASQLEFEIAPDVLSAMKSMTDRISIISAERAEKLGVKTGDSVRVFNKRGAITLSCEIRDIEKDMRLDRYKTHDIEVVIDRLLVNAASEKRLEETIKTAMYAGDNIMMVLTIDENQPRYFSRELMCPETGIAYPNPEPNTFSFNSPKGACETCNGLGIINEINLQKVIPNDTISIKNGGKKICLSAMPVMKISPLLTRASRLNSGPSIYSSKSFMISG